MDYSCCHGTLNPSTQRCFQIFSSSCPFQEYPCTSAHHYTLTLLLFLNMDIQPWPTDFMKRAFFTPSLPRFTFHRACFMNSFLLSILEQSWRDGMQDENSLIGTFFYCPLMELQANYIFHRGTDVLSGLRYHHWVTSFWDTAWLLGSNCHFIIDSWSLATSLKCQDNSLLLDTLTFQWWIGFWQASCLETRQSKPFCSVFFLCCVFSASTLLQTFAVLPSSMNEFSKVVYSLIFCTLWKGWGK